jgi:hypothetical protein
MLEKPNKIVAKKTKIVFEISTPGQPELEKMILEYCLKNDIQAVKKNPCGCKDKKGD